MIFSNEPMTDLIRRALISVSNKAGLLEFAHRLISKKIEILATGGTATLLKKNGIPLTVVADYTGFPEILDGRVKTLHPKIYAGLLSRPGVDEAVLASHQIQTIDLLVVNLYPFQETISQPNCTFEQAIEQIDIGGPAMVRAAAKNHANVTVVVDPEDYELVWRHIETSGKPDGPTRRILAQKAFVYTSAYDQAISKFLENNQEENLFPPLLQSTFRKKMDLRYGENPHQKAALYANQSHQTGCLTTAPLLQGKPLTYNNLLDADAALQCVRSLDNSSPGCVIIKHGTPCGAAQDSNLHQAYLKALATDPVSAFGGIVACNRTIDLETAQEIISRQFVEVLLAPAVADNALQLLASKPTWRILACSTDLPCHSLSLRSIDGGLLVQQEDLPTQPPDYKTVTARAPTSEELKDLLFAWQVAQYVKSNAIVYAKGQATLAIGGGQTSRVFSAEIAEFKAQKMGIDLKGSVAASDGFFPFADGVEVLAKAGVSAIIQPGGSKRDEEVIAAANRYHIAMVFTGVRHFRH
jgi:phosphoribosylaminoimidazolecarboxamide formyltransferase / IMP cyclohydrolase